MKRKHSRFSIASFLVSILAVGATVLVFMVASHLMESWGPGGIAEYTPEGMYLLLFILATLVIDLVAIGLGIAGVARKGTVQVFAIVGIALAGIAGALSALLVLGSIE